MKRKTNFKTGIKKSVAKQKQDESSYGYLALPKDVKMFKEKEGNTKLDFIPYEVTIPNHPDLIEAEGIAAQGSLWYRLPFKVHRNVGTGNDTVICPTTFGKKCPICEYRRKRAGEGADKEELKTLTPSKRNLYAVIPIGDKEHEESVHVWDISNFLFQQLLNQELDENEENAVFPDLENGKTLKIRFEEQSLEKNKFCQANRIDFLDRDEAYDESILDDVPSLEKLLIVLSYKELELKFFELEDEVASSEETIDDDEEAPKPARKKKTIKPDPEDDDEEAGKSSRRKKPAAKPEPDPDDDDDDDDDGIDIPVDERCIACGGTGMTSKGRRCPICDGTGRKPEVDDDDEDKTPDDYRPARKSNSVPPAPPATRKPAGAKNKCPHGHVFGKDADLHDECAKCPQELWDKCSDGE